MIGGNNNAYEICIDAASATAAGTITSQVIDTLISSSLNTRANYLSLPIWSTTSDVVSNCPTVLKLQEADVTNTSSFTDIVAFVGGTQTSATVGYVIPNWPTATTQQVQVAFEVDLKARKRYIRLLVSPATSQTYKAIAILSRSGIASATAAYKNVSGIVVSG